MRIPLVALALAALACHTATPPPAPAPQPRPAPAVPAAPVASAPESVRAPRWAAASRSAEECREVLAHGPASPNAPVVPPIADTIIVPPFDGVPYVQRGVKIQVQLFVDPSGAVAADSTRLDPMITSRRYDGAFRAALARMRFHPAVVEGCAVPAWTALTVTLPD